WLRSKPRLWQMLNSRAERRIMSASSMVSISHIEHPASQNRLAIVIGYGPVGRAVDRLLSSAGMDTVVIDMNMDTISELHRQQRHAVFGDAVREAILEQAGIKRATHLVVTLPAAT